jgi:hypothetical protein
MGGYTNIKIYMKDTECEDVDCFQVTQGIIHLQDRVNTVMNMEGPQRQGISLPAELYQLIKEFSPWSWYINSSTENLKNTSLISIFSIQTTLNNHVHFPFRF